MITWQEIVFRLLLAAFISGIIGIEREISNRPAGFRTHMLVTLGATLIMLISVDVFADSDPGRLAAQVVSGIGFLGAGTIMRTGNNIVGLTTAASLWVCAGIGLAIGAGYYVGAIATTVIILIILMSTGLLERTILRKRYGSIELAAVNRPGIIGDIEKLFASYKVSIRSMNVTNVEAESLIDGNSMEIHLLVKMPAIIHMDELYRDIYKVSGVFGVSSEGSPILRDGHMGW